MNDIRNIEPLNEREWLLWNTGYNVAIEAAAKCAELNIDDCEIHTLIRKLRK